MCLSSCGCKGTCSNSIFALAELDPGAVLSEPVIAGRDTLSSAENLLGEDVRIIDSEEDSSSSDGDDHDVVDLDGDDDDIEEDDCSVIDVDQRDW